MITLATPVVSAPATQFTEALAQNVASIVYNLPVGPRSGSGRYLIRAIEVVTTDNFGPEFNFFGSAVGPTTDVNTDTFVGRFGFLSANGEQLSASGLWRYYNNSLAIPFVDLDTINTPTPPSLHVVLQNLSATGKGAGANTIKATIWVEPADDVY